MMKKISIDKLIRDSVKVLHIDNIQIVGKNKKYINSKTTGRPILSPEYRDFKKLIYFSTKKTTLKPPYFIYIECACAHDIDAPESAILDGMQGRAYKNDNQIKGKTIIREEVKRGRPGSIKAYIASI